MKKYIFELPNGAKVIVKAKKLKWSSLEYVPLQTGFRPICEHGEEKA